VFHAVLVEDMNDFYQWGLMCMVDSWPYGLIDKNPRNGQKCVCNLSLTLVVDFQDGLERDSNWCNFCG
jgi:hypothetical protein